MFNNLNVLYNAKTKCISREAISHNQKYYGIGHMLFTAMRKYENNIAQIDAATHRQVSYKELLLKSIRCALRMRALGVKKGDLIALSSNNHLNLIVPLIATQLLGAILTSIDRLLSFADNKYMLDLIQPKLIFVIDAIVEPIIKIIDELNLNTRIITFGRGNDNLPIMAFDEFLQAHPDENDFQPYMCERVEEAVFVIFSSGTTGKPKGIYKSHNEYRSVIGAEEFRDIRIGMYYAEIFWTVSFSHEIMFITNGITNVVVDFMDNDSIWEYIETFKINYLYCVASIFNKLSLVQPTTKVSSLKCLRFGGDLCNGGNIKKVATWLPHTCIANVYGCTQIGQMSYFQRYETIVDKLHSCGYPTPGTAIKIVDPNTKQALGFNQNGDVYVKRVSFPGYYKDMYDYNNQFDLDGFFKTGDVGYYDHDCCLYIVGRECDTFRCYIWRVTPSIIEEILLSHSDVVEAAVIGIASVEYDNVAMGFAVLQANSELTEEELLQFVNSRVEHFHLQLHGGVRYVKSLPKTSLGKINRKCLLSMMNNNKL